MDALIRSCIQYLITRKKNVIIILSFKYQLIELYAIIELKDKFHIIYL